jgi:hypothetical protein
MSVATLMDDVMTGGQFLPEAGLPLAGGSRCGAPAASCSSS